MRLSVDYGRALGCVCEGLILCSSIHLKGRTEERSRNDFRIFCEISLFLGVFDLSLLQKKFSRKSGSIDHWRVVHASDLSSHFFEKTFFEVVTNQKLPISKIGATNIVEQASSCAWLASESGSASA